MVLVMGLGDWGEWMFFKVTTDRKQPSYCLPSSPLRPSGCQTAMCSLKIDAGKAAPNDEYRISDVPSIPSSSHVEMGWGDINTDRGRLWTHTLSLARHLISQHPSYTDEGGDPPLKTNVYLAALLQGFGGERTGKGTGEEWRGLVTTTTPPRLKLRSLSLSLG